MENNITLLFPSTLFLVSCYFNHTDNILTWVDILAEVPSNMVLNKFAKPSQYMATIMFIWGIVVVCTGLIHNFGQLCAIRILLGLFE